MKVITPVEIARPLVPKTFKAREVTKLEARMFTNILPTRIVIRLLLGRAIIWEINLPLFPIAFIVKGLREKRAVSAPEKKAERQRQTNRIRRLKDIMDNLKSPL